MAAHPLIHLSRVKFLEFIREPEAIFWVLIFPVLLSLALGIAFRSKAPEPLAIAVVSGVGAEEAARHLATDAGLRPKVLAESEARLSLRTGKVALVTVTPSANVPVSNTFKLSASRSVVLLLTGVSGPVCPTSGL